MKFFSVTFFIYSLFSITALYASDSGYASLQEKYKKGESIKVLIVPGHDNEFSGAQFGDISEAELTLITAQVVGSYLSQDPKIKVTILRNENGYDARFLEYFSMNKEKIMLDVAHKKDLLDKQISNNEVTIGEQINHVDATSTVVETLYIINSWVDKEDFDLVIHIHFNDYGGRFSDEKPKYSGFSIYTPSQELLNATTSKIFAQSIGRRLQKTFYSSNHPEEEKESDEFGVIPDFYLIAMGAYKTTHVPRILIEYSYIYEPHLGNGSKDMFTISAQTFARATASGVHDFLVNKKDSKVKNLEYSWYELMKTSQEPKSEVLALQYGLRELGFFPPKKMSKDECFFSGIFGLCTKKALIAFQERYGLSRTGYAGPSTRQKLNRIFTD